MVLLRLLALFLISSGVESRRRPDYGRPETNRLLMGGPATSRNFPYACVIVCCGNEYTSAVSMCSIVDETFIVTSLSNLAKKSDYQGEKTRYFEPTMHNLLRVVAGSDALIPGAEVQLHEVMSKKMQVKLVKNIYVIRDNVEVYNLKVPLNTTVFVNPPTLENVFRNSYDFEFPFAFVEIEGKFTWTNNVEPLPRLHKEAMTEVKTTGDQYIKLLNAGYSRDVCYAPGWGLSHSDDIGGVRRMVYQKVVNIDIVACRNTYCTNDIKTCTKYPDPRDRFLMCFKSLQYGDSCTLDKSAGMYCQSYHESVLALLSNTLACGIEGTPPVYWLTPVVLAVYDRIKEEKGKRTKFRFLKRGVVSGSS